jgi:hypothetical protein
MPENLLYMNQGGNGDWGAINYADYGVLCLAESTVLKEHFEESYNSRTQPPMSVQIKSDGVRRITGVADLDWTCKEVRPLLIFQLTGLNVLVVFSHLKSASEKFATNALATAVERFLVSKGGKKDIPVLWIGDFNRAEAGAIADNFNNFELLLKGGGIAKWDLDRAYRTGNWTNIPIGSKKVATSGDNQHIAIRVTIGN